MSLELQLKGYTLITAEILYPLPDYPDILQQFIWQEYDQAPKFPVLQKFILFWQKELIVPIHSVRVAAKKLVIMPLEIRVANTILEIN